MTSERLATVFGLRNYTCSCKWRMSYETVTNKLFFFDKSKYKRVADNKRICSRTFTENKFTHLKCKTILLFAQYK